LVCVLAATAGVLAGCRNQEAPPETLKPIVVGPVKLYGMNLGPGATPQEVTFALMQALRETVTTARRRHLPDRREALQERIENELELCAPSRIYQNVIGTLVPEGVELKERDNVVYKIVKLWAPIAARYVDCFSSDAAKMIAAMRVKRLSETDARVSYDVTDPVDHTKMTFQVFLTLEPGTEPAYRNEKFWRVYRLGYARFGHDEASSMPAGTRPATSQATSRPTTGPSR
jgi:hypothetical protein